MAYYFVIVSPRDSPLYEAHLSSKPASSSVLSSTTSFFSQSAAAPSPNQPPASAAASSLPRSSGEGGIFGFAASLQALAGGLRGAGSEAGAPEAAASSASQGANSLGFAGYSAAETLQMIAHSSLDAVEDRQWTSSTLYLKAVDRINEWTVSAFLVPGNIKMLILHEHRHDDGIRNFFLDVWELLVKTLLNPLHDPQAPIRSVAFDARVRASARKHL